MGQVYQCWLWICREINILFSFEYHMFYALYHFVAYLLTLPGSSIQVADVSTETYPTHAKNIHVRFVIYNTLQKFLTMVQDKTGKMLNYFPCSACHLLSHWFFVWRILLPWIWRRHFPPKRLLDSNRLHGFVPKKIVRVLFTTMLVKTSNPIFYVTYHYPILHVTTIYSDVFVYRH
jgi:hypothetical protein